MNLSDDGAKFISGHEGMILQPYEDPSGFCTIGIGHLIGRRGCTQADYDKWGTLTEEQAFDLFRSDARRFIDAVNSLVTVSLTQNQFDALVSFSFNVGEGNLRSSTLLRKLNSGDYQGAANEFPKWNKSAGRVLRGLTRRRAEERELFLRPDSGQVAPPPEQDIPRLPGESLEVAHMRDYINDSGVPHRVTSTVRSKLPSRHAQDGTDGEGLAVDLAGPVRSRNSPELLAIFEAFQPVENQLYELIYSGASYNIKRGKRVPRYAIDDHWDHVHVATDRGVFIVWPNQAISFEEEDMAKHVAYNGKIYVTDGVWRRYVNDIGVPDDKDIVRQFEKAELAGTPRAISKQVFDTLVDVDEFLKRLGSAPKLTGKLTGTLEVK